LVFRYWTRNKVPQKWVNFFEKEEEENEKIIDTTPIAKGATFKIVINVLLTGYNINIDERPTIEIEMNIGYILPPWSADHIFVRKIQQSITKKFFH
jgi:hypothetical protein